MTVLTKLEDIALGGWGIYLYDKFFADFQKSPEFKRARFECQDFNRTIKEYLLDSPLPVIVSDSDSVDGLYSAIYEFAKGKIPRRFAGLGGIALDNPTRNNRPCASPLIPIGGSDPLEFIVKGDKEKGHAIVLGYDYEDLDIDNSLITYVPLRQINKEPAHSATIVNKFHTYVRIMDDELYCLLRKIGFFNSNDFLDGKRIISTSIPFGINSVSFPLEYYKEMNVPLFNLYSTMKSSQSTLNRIISSTKIERPIYNTFFNVGRFAGGTVTRTHMQIYIRTRIEKGESYDYPEEGKVSLRNYHESSTKPMELQPSNSTWQAYFSPARAGKYDIRFELKSSEKKEFIHLNDKELWGISEMLIYHTNTFKEYLSEKLKEQQENGEEIEVSLNMLFYPKCVIMHPFVTVGGHEIALNEYINDFSYSTFIREYNSFNNRGLSRDFVYNVPNDARGLADYQRLMDENSIIYKNLRAVA